MRLGHPHWAHLDYAEAHAAPRELPCGLAAGQTRANNGYDWIGHYKHDDRAPFERRCKPAPASRASAAIALNPHEH